MDKNISMFSHKHADVFFISVQKCRKFVQMFFMCCTNSGLKLSVFIRKTDGTSYFRVEL